MGIVRMGPPEDLILSLKEKFEIKNFVETGTYMGATAKWASKYFEKVSTVEKSDAIFSIATSNLSGIDNINIMNSDSRDALRELVREIKAPAIFWLDSHWSGGETYGEGDECPLIEELDIIYQSSVPHLLLIDDARLFLSPPPMPHDTEHWPTISDVLFCIHSHDKESYTIVIDDVIVSVPQYAKSLLIDFAKKHADQSKEKYTRRNSTFVGKILNFLEK